MAEPPAAGGNFHPVGRADVGRSWGLSPAPRFGHWGSVGQAGVGVAAGGVPVCSLRGKAIWDSTLWLHSWCSASALWNYRGYPWLADFINSKEWALVLESVFCEIHSQTSVPRMSCWCLFCLISADHELSLSNYFYKWVHNFCCYFTQMPTPNYKWQKETYPSWKSK